MRKLYIFLFLLLFIYQLDAQTTVTLVADKDNTIFSASTSNSNGAGIYFFVGQNSSNNANSTQRALLHFNLSAIPAGAAITSATLSLSVNKTAATPTGIDLHKLTADWGEGASDAAGNEGSGAPATPGDATWTHRFFPSTLWGSPGGQFSPIVSASIASISANIRSPQNVFLTGSGLIADIQSWVSGSSPNFGWILTSNNETLEQSAKRFASTNNTTAAQRPSLSITYSTSLPVTLKGFSASLTKQSATLKWSTATEIDNDHFEIEHSVDGKDFSFIAQVQSSGNSTTEHSYTYLHQNVSAGKHFYRIVDIDKTGNKRYSQIITVMSGSTSSLQLYPNPATSFISVTGSSLLQGNEFSITTVTGQVVLKGIIAQQQIDVKKLASGQYWFLVKTKEGDLLKSQFLKR